MNKTVKKKKPEVNAELENIDPQPVPEPELPPEPKKQMSMIERIQFMNSMAEATTDKDLVDAFHSLKNGKNLYDLFVSSVNSKIEGMMNGDNSEVVETVSTLGESSQKILDQMFHMHMIMKALHNETLIKALALLNQNLGGKALPAEQHFDAPPAYVPTQVQHPVAPQYPVAPQNAAPQQPAPPPPGSQPKYSPEQGRTRGGRTPGMF